MTATRRLGLGAILTIGISLFPAEVIRPGNASGDTASCRVSEETVTDIDGNAYTTVTIGSQTWMVENLKVTSYRDGTRIPRVEDDEEWSSLVSGAYCHPALDPSLEAVAYGLLYNFFAVSDCRGLCPDGWRVPTEADWRRLIEFLGGVDVAGGKMKATWAGSWRYQIQGTNNESGFSAVPAGGRGQFGGAGEAGNYATWWSSTLDDSLYAWHWGLHPDKNEVRANPGHVQSGFSVRCMKDSGDH